MKAQPDQVLEDKLVARLVCRGYARAAVTDEDSMLANLNAQLEAFNGVSLTGGEFTKVLHHLNKSAGVFNKAKTLRDRMKLEEEDGNTVYLERFVYTGARPLPDPDIVDLIERPLTLAERGPTKKRVLERVVEYVETFIKGIAA